ncbi:adenylosuccinate lyase [Janibacter sp. HTCC2649]|nr:hypothetical protein [Janibacter sp. HTCC2649]EAQ00835.1 adenylosuccinate lyase [Janibacter sp. HTCC2649]
MHDLPAAGALWFVTGRDDANAREAIAAWREQHGDAAAQWRTIPGPLRAALASEPHLVHLQEEARQAERTTIQRHEAKVRAAQPRADRVLDVVGTLILCGVALSIIAIFGVGVWTIGRWIAS